MLDRAEQMLARARRLDLPVTALFVDIDGFKQINDRFGHRAGDEVLRQVGARLRTVLRDSDTVGRLGGDEFVMLVDSRRAGRRPRAGRRADPGRAPPADRAASIRTSADLRDGEHRHRDRALSVSAEDLMQDADLALYKAKAAGKDGYAMFESAMQTAAQDRIHLEMDLANALDAEQFFLVYQPMLDLRERADRRRRGAAALAPPRRGVSRARRVHPDRRGKRADRPHRPLGARAGLRARPPRGSRMGYPLNISVNVSARQLERGEFVEEVRAALYDSGLDPETLTLEITETVLMRKPEHDRASAHRAEGARRADRDRRLRHGLQLARLPAPVPGRLAEDRPHLHHRPGASPSEAHALTHTLIQLGKALGLETLAEGVEHHGQVRELQREGCDLAQGFLFARPLTPQALERFLADSPRLTAQR